MSLQSLAKATDARFLSLAQLCGFNSRQSCVSNLLSCCNISRRGSSWKSHFSPPNSSTLSAPYAALFERRVHKHPFTARNVLD
jgi:hypothetical protein